MLFSSTLTSSWASMFFFPGRLIQPGSATLVRVGVVLFVSAVLAACQNAGPKDRSNTVGDEEPVARSDLSYPSSRRDAVVDEYFGQTVADPYRWLEDDRSRATADWVRRQNKLTQSFLDAVPYRAQIAARLQRLLDYERVSAPFREGEFTYFYRNNGLQNQDVLYRQRDGEPEELFIDPNTFSEDGTISMSGLSLSPDASVLAYQLSEGGSDWLTIHVLDAASGEPREAPLQNVKFSGISWVGSEGFYYSSYDRPDGSVLSAKTDTHKLFFHRLGTRQDEDSLIFGGAASEQARYVGASVTEDQRFLLVSASTATSGNRLYLVDLDRMRQSPVADHQLIPVVDHERSDTRLVDSRGDTLFLYTNLDAPNGRVIRVDAATPTPDRWKDFIAEREQVLSVSTGGGYFFAKYLVDAATQVEQINDRGALVRQIALPDTGTASGFAGKYGEQELFYEFVNYRLPGTIFSFDVGNGESQVYRRSNSSFASDNYVSRQVFFESADGTRIPMTITHKVGLEKNGSHPTLLYGYGGFNISLRPRFSSTGAAWLELGGVYRKLYELQLSEEGAEVA